MTTYRASPTSRARRTKADIAAIRDAIVEVIEDDPPMTVRQVFYRQRAAVQEGDARHPARDHQRHVEVGRDVPHDAGERVLLAPDFNVVSRLLKRATAVEFCSLFERVLDIVVSFGDPKSRRGFRARAASCLAARGKTMSDFARQRF